MSLLRFAWVIAIGRALRGWRLEAVFFSGILLAVALMASGVIFSELLSNAALRDALSRSEPEDVNLKIRSFSSRDDPPDMEGREAAFRARDEFIRQNVQEPFQHYLRHHARFIKSASFLLSGTPPTRGRPRFSDHGVRWSTSQELTHASEPSRASGPRGQPRPASRCPWLWTGRERNF